MGAGVPWYHEHTLYACIGVVNTIRVLAGGSVR